MKRGIIILWLFMLTLGIVSSCMPEDEIIRGYGRSVEVFTDIDTRRVLEIEAEDNIDIEIVPSNYFETYITAQENILDLITIRIVGNVARVGFSHRINVIPTDITKVTFFLPRINAIISNGSGDIVCYNGFSSYNDMYVRTNSSGDIFLSGLSCKVFESIVNSSGEIRINNIAANEIFSTIRGSGEISINGFSTPYLNTFINGSGDIKYRGDTHTHFISIEGSGTVESYSLNAENIKVEVRGSGTSYVWANRYLDVDIRGSGNVYYKGHPHISIIGNGSGRLIKG